jgi:alkylation response protein AidB-like acyl-CoA dehydrogenase
MPAKALVGEAGDGLDDEAECTGQGLGAVIPEAQGSGSLALTVEGLMDVVKERRADGTALAGTFDHKQTVVDLAGLLDELGQVP